MALHVHRAERSDTLVGALAQVLSTPPEDPFTPEVIAVPTRGVERWVRQQLAHTLGTGTGGVADGVCALVDMPSPESLFADLLAELDGLEAEADPWRPDSLPFRVLEVIEHTWRSEWCAPLAVRLGYPDPGDRDPATGTSPATAADRRYRAGQRLSVARHLASLLRGYAADRPQLLRDWADLDGPDLDGIGRPLAEQFRWQPHLWRALRHHLDHPDPVTRLDRATQRLARDPALSTLPRRLHVFGPTRLPTATLHLLAALAGHREVHLWLPNPSPAQWRRLAEQPPARPVRAADRSVDLIRNPLLRSLGRDSRELQLRLSALAGGFLDSHHGDAHGGPPGSALQVLHRAVWEDLPTPAQAAQRALLRPEDDSIQVHACHGRHRQVEVLREVILGLLADDETLQPRDILVMCPDIDTYAALILGAFGSGLGDGSGHPGQYLRVRLADRGLRQTNPVLDVLSRLLSLASGRVTSADVLDLLSLAPVQRRFGLDDAALDTLRDWVQRSNIRWGLTAADRTPYGLGSLGATNTWHHGTDRWLHGVAMNPEDQPAGAPGWPLGGIESSQADLTGRGVEVVHRLARVLRRLRDAGSVSASIAALREGLDLLTRADGADSWQRNQADRLLASTETASGATPLQISLSDLRALLADQLRGRPTRTSFRTGDLTFCSMVPMRTVPHRVVCVLGADDGDLPRRPPPVGDDVLADDPVVGERDIPAEDRQLLLDAVLAATDHLVLLYSGADERTGAERPPAVPIGEILDDLDHRLRHPDGTPGGTALTRRHSPQPFNPSGFLARPPGRGFSFDAAALAGARAKLSPPQPLTPFLSRPLAAPADSDVVDLDDLVNFYTHPVRHFATRNLGLSLRDFSSDLQTELPLELSPLQQWAVGDQMLRQALGGADRDSVRAAQLRSGALPPGRLGTELLDRLLDEVTTVLAASSQYRGVPPATRPVFVPLPDGRVLRGSVGGVRGTTIAEIGYSRVKAGGLLSLWVKLLALRSSAGPDGLDAVAIGKGGRPHRLSAPSVEAAGRQLAELIACFDAGRRQVLPLPPNSALEYAICWRRQLSDTVRTNQTRKVWSAGDFPENRDPEYRLLLPPTVEGLESVVPVVEPSWPPMKDSAASWFGRIAVAVFDPLLEFRS